HPDWHPGVLGIVASRLVERFARPVVMLSINNGEAHGSARSVDGVSIHEALAHCAEHLRTFGGHAMAAGLRLDTDRIDAFREALIAFVNEQLDAESLCGTIDIDAECEMNELSVDLYQQLNALAPFGRDNLPPRLCLRNVRVARQPLRVGGN